MEEIMGMGNARSAKKTYQIVIPHRFHGLNEFIEADRKRKGRWSGGNAMKQEDQEIIRRYLPDVNIKRPVHIYYTFYERDCRRDKDNISGYFHKIFQDALVDGGMIPNDGWKNIAGFSDAFHIDREYPRVEVVLVEV